jgi:hypothetical protein
MPPPAETLWLWSAASPLSSALSQPAALWQRLRNRLAERSVSLRSAFGRCAAFLRARRTRRDVAGVLGRRRRRQGAGSAGVGAVLNCWQAELEDSRPRSAEQARKQWRNRRSGCFARMTGKEAVEGETSPWQS